MHFTHASRSRTPIAIVKQRGRPQLPVVARRPVPGWFPDRSTNHPRRRVAATAGALLTGAVCAAADWPNFRGPAHDGISPETGFAKRWTAAIPLVWERTVGSAFSSFACVGERVYTCGTEEGRQTIFCLNAADGAIVWKLPFEAQFRDPQGGDGTRATPTVADGRVFILGGHGRFLCLDAADGKVLWEKKFNGEPQWGYSGSALVEGDRVIVSPGGAAGALAAFDCATGSEVWKCGDDPAGYATPYPFVLDGTRYVAGFTGKSAIVAEAATGRLVWRVDWQTDWDVNASSPIFHDGCLFLSSGYQTGCALFRLRREGDRLTDERVWPARGASKTIMNKFQTPILYDGHLYTSDQKALVCVEFATGQEKWRKPRLKHGTLVVADGYLLFLTEGGQLQIARATPDGYEPETTADILSDRCWTVPVLHKGRFYARSLERVVCFNLRP